MKPLRLLLNSALSGANLFFALGQVDGSFRAAGIELSLTAGQGAWTAAGRLLREDFDLAYGDVNALVHLAQSEPAADLPIAICALHQHAPTVISVSGDSPIRSPAGLHAARIVGHGHDVALRTFAPFARASGLDTRSVEILPSEQPMAELLRQMLGGRHDAVFGYASTHTAALAGLGLEADHALRFLHYRDACPALYGSALMASARMLRLQPALATRLVALLRAKVAEARAHPARALDALQAMAPGVDRAVESRRWAITLRDDMGLRDAPGADWGLFDARRLASSIAAMADAEGWLAMPAVERIAPATSLASTSPTVSAAAVPPR